MQSYVAAQSPQLPAEVWYLILLNTLDPTNLSRTSRAIHNLSRSPSAAAAWLLQRHSPRFAFHGALWWWTDARVWRLWLLESAQQHHLHRHEQNDNQHQQHHQLPPLFDEDSRHGHQHRSRRSHPVVALCSRLFNIAAFYRWLARRFATQGIPDHKPHRCPRCNGSAHHQESRPKNGTSGSLATLFRSSKYSRTKISPALPSDSTMLDMESSSGAEDGEEAGAATAETSQDNGRWASPSRHNTLFFSQDQLQQPEPPPQESLPDTTPLPDHSESTSHCSFEDYQLAICRVLIAHHADMQSVQELLLRFAARTGHMRLLAFFLDNLDLTDPVTSETTHCLLVQAISRNEPSVVRVLASSGVLKSMDEECWTSIASIAVQRQSPAIVAALLDHKPSPPPISVAILASRYTTSPKWNPLSRVRLPDALSVFHLVLAALPQTQFDMISDGLVVSAGEHGDVATMRTLVARGAIISSQDHMAFFSSILLGNTAMTRYILKEHSQTRPSIMDGPKLFLIVLMVVDHAALWFAFLTAFLASGVAVVCAAGFHSDSAVSLFGITASPARHQVSNGWCISQNSSWTAANSTLINYTNEPDDNELAAYNGPGDGSGWWQHCI
ncbi:hypothetical protein BC831DRAFT_506593, partial [Entophlyctis helioformis]